MAGFSKYIQSMIRSSEQVDESGDCSKDSEGRKVCQYVCINFVLSLIHTHFAFFGVHCLLSNYQLGGETW